MLNKDVIDRLEIFKPIQKDKFVELNLPIIVDLYKNCLIVRIVPTKNGYMVCDDGNLFENFNNSAKYYFELFMKNKNNTYNYSLNGEVFYKNYSEDCSLTIAIDEFIKFILNINNYILDNDIT